MTETCNQIVSAKEISPSKTKNKERFNQFYAFYCIKNATY